jgi:hypothetical protein
MSCMLTLWNMSSGCWFINNWPQILSSAVVKATGGLAAVEASVMALAVPAVEAANSLAVVDANGSLAVVEAAGCGCG